MNNHNLVCYNDPYGLVVTIFLIMALGITAADILDWHDRAFGSPTLEVNEVERFRSRWFHFGL